jgi:SAM-dependent methyltransferase
MSTPSDTSARQRDHYNAIHAEYEEHYGDATSLEYRERFFLDPLLDGLSLDGCLVADLASGAGYSTIALRRRFNGIRAVGFDISEAACEAYRVHTGSQAHVCDLTRGQAPATGFDAAIIVGGLHHCVANLPVTLSTVAAMLKPGGHFLFVEPSRDCWLEPLRRLWYRSDRYFEEQTEAAVSHDGLAEMGRAWFAPEHVRYLGGPAYFLIYNSLVLRIPLGAKRAIAGPLMAAERLTNRLPGRGPFPFFVARWRRL